MTKPDEGLTVFWSFALLLIFFIFSSAGAQVVPVAVPSRVEPTGRSGEPPKLPKQFETPTPPPGTLLPPAPIPPKTEALPSLRVFVREIKVTGSTVFTDEELAKVTAPYVNRELTSEDLEALRVALTLLYVNNGYVNSGAILPDQRLTEGVVTYQIIEGRLTAVDVEGNRWFRSSYFQKRFDLDAGPPLNINALQQRLRLLLEDSRIQRLNAQLKPGLQRGEGILDVRVEDRAPYRFLSEYNNYQSPAVGENRGLVNLWYDNVTGNGDVFFGQYGRSSGLNPLLDFKYGIPVNAYDTTLSYEYRRNTLAVIEQPFQPLSVKSKSDIYTYTIRQPVFRTLNSDLSLELIGEREWLQTTLLGENFSLEPGAQHGRSVVFALRPAQEFVYRTPSQVIAALSRFSFGLNAFGATVNHNGLPDGTFFAWQGQFQWVQRFSQFPWFQSLRQYPWLQRTGLLDTYAIFRQEIQYSDSPLLSLEQVSIGGRYSVRGYRENTLLRDRAVLASLELRFPVASNTAWADYLELAPFYDFGAGWDVKLKTPSPQNISSVGIGFRWARTFSNTFESPVSIRPQFEFYWGYRLRTVFNPRNSLQDNGIHLQFGIEVF
jgi:hemolysin activation/secretion protein